MMLNLTCSDSDMLIRTFCIDSNQSHVVPLTVREEVSSGSIEGLHNWTREHNWYDNTIPVLDPRGCENTNLHFIFLGSKKDDAWVPANRLNQTGLPHLSGQVKQKTWLSRVNYLCANTVPVIFFAVLTFLAGVSVLVLYLHVHLFIHL